MFLALRYRERKKRSGKVNLDFFFAHHSSRKILSLVIIYVQSRLLCWKHSHTDDPCPKEGLFSARQTQRPSVALLWHNFWLYLRDAGLGGAEQPGWL